MMCEEAVQFEFPVLEEPFSASEIHELWSIFQPELPSLSTSSTSETTRSIYSPEVRKIRRKISNRESAKRSRLRKKMHLENLQDQVNQLRTENRLLKNQLCLVTNDYQMLQRETDRLQVESFLLQQRLAALTQILHPMQLQ